MSNYDPKSMQAGDFINHEEIVETLDAARTLAQDPALVRSLLDKAARYVGLTHRAAAVLLAVQDPVRAWLVRRMGSEEAHAGLEKWSWVPVGIASVYGGYFGAGLSVIVLSALGLTMHDSLTRLNALKQGVAFAVNVAAALFFLFSGQVVWPMAIVMAAGALLGGILGGKLAGRVKPATLRWVVVSAGVVISIVYFIRG